MVIIQAESRIRKLRYVIIKPFGRCVSNEMLSPGQVLPQHNCTSMSALREHVRTPPLLPHKNRGVVAVVAVL